MIAKNTTEEIVKVMLKTRLLNRKVKELMELSEDLNYHISKMVEEISSELMNED